MGYIFLYMSFKKFSYYTVPLLNKGMQITLYISVMWCYLLQVETRAASLNTNAVFIVITAKKYFAWVGKVGQCILFYFSFL